MKRKRNEKRKRKRVVKKKRAEPEANVIHMSEK